MDGIVTSIYHDNFYSDRHSTYFVYFGHDVIRTTVTSDSDVVTSWLGGVNTSSSGVGRLIVGLDIKWRSRRGHGSYPASTLQISVDERCLIFQLLHADLIPQPLIDFLSDRNKVFVGVGIESGLEKLRSDHNFGFGVNWRDLRSLAAERHGTQDEDLTESSLNRLLEVVLQINRVTPQYVGKSRWDEEILSPAQIRYAAIDAYACLLLGRALIATDS